jgi:hypothetical protein
MYLVSMIWQKVLDSPLFFGSETCGESGRLPALSSVRIPDTMMKPCVSTGSDFKVSGATSTEWPAKVCLMWHLDWAIMLFSPPPRKKTTVLSTVECLYRVSWLLYRTNWHYCERLEWVQLLGLKILGLLEAIGVCKCNSCCIARTTRNRSVKGGSSQTGNLPGAQGWGSR